MSLTNYAEDLTLKHLFTGTAVTRPTAWFVGLFTAAPGEAAGGTELSTSGTGYARQSGAFTVSGTAPTQATNSAAIEYPTATSAWGTITHVAIFDAATGGNMIAYAALTASKTIASGDVFRIPAANLTITLE